MEASEAAQGQNAPEAGAQAGSEGQEPQGQETNPLVDRFDQFESGFNDRLDSLEERLPDADPGQEPEADDDGPAYYEYEDRPGEIFDEQGNPVDPAQLEQQEQQRALSQLQQNLRGELHEQLAPVLEYFKDRQAADLESKYPRLQQDPEHAGAVLQQAQEMAQRYGNPELADNAEFLELVHHKLEGQERAAQETPAGSPEQGAHLETTAVSQPGSGEVDPGDRIVEVARQRRSFFDS